MGDNPFAEPDDSDRTIIRPVPGGRRPATPSAAAPSPAPPPGLADPVGPLGGAEAAMALDTGISPLAAAAGPLLLLLARLRNTARPPDAGDLRQRAVAALQEFERQGREFGVPMDLLRPAHYALCASLDDVVMATPWGSGGGNAGSWEARSLVSTFHHEVQSGERFFDILAQLRRDPAKYLPVLELMYLCMSLGMMGRYRLSPRGGGIEQLREETYALIARMRGAAADPALSPHWKGVLAPYKPKRGTIPIWAAAVTAVAGVVAFFVYSTFQLNAASDDALAHMLAAPPDHMPAIARSAPVQAVTPPPPPSQPEPPNALDRLRTFLKPEVDQGLVVVLGTPDVPIVRILNRGMFPSGSATLQTSFVPLLERIGQALADEHGPVRVVGYTDDQPIRTVRFPSNFALSSARADAAKEVIAYRIGDPARLSSEGRADANPVASNATPEGREQNRRIEVVLQRTP